MRLGDKISIAGNLLSAKFFGKKIPLIVGWPITNRCNYRCVYCDRWEDDTDELTGDTVRKIIDEIKSCGTRVVIFGGGEPLLYEDIGSVINYCRDRGIYVGINTNGSLVPKRIDDIKRADSVRLSFDGPKDVNDAVRGKGSYDAVIKAVEILKQNGIPVKFNTTLTKYNISHVNHIINKSREIEVPVKFQPVSYAHKRKKDIGGIFPSKEEYKKAIDAIILGKKNNPFVINSLSALRYLYNWPKQGIFKNCYAGKVICRIGPGGKVFPCTMIRDKQKYYNCAKIGFENAFKQMPLSSCDGCWCTATLEINRLLDFKLDAIKGLAKIS